MILVRVNLTPFLVPAVVNAIIAKFFVVRALFESREGPSKTFSWFAMITSFILTSVSIIFMFLLMFLSLLSHAGSCFIVAHRCCVSDMFRLAERFVHSLNQVGCYLLPAKFLPRQLRSINASVRIRFSHDPIVQLLVSRRFPPSCSQHIYTHPPFRSEILFSFALASAAPTPTAAANILPFLLASMAIVNGIIVPHRQMTNPWRDFVYWVNPVVSTFLTLKPGIAHKYLTLTLPGLTLDL